MDIVAGSAGVIDINSSPHSHAFTTFSTLYSPIHENTLIMSGAICASQIAHSQLRCVNRSLNSLFSKITFKLLIYAHHNSLTYESVGAFII